MIGNDIVDLRDAETRPGERTPAFDTRVFTSAERARIAGAPDPVRERWTLWAAKEAAFKLARKCQPGSSFIPRRFEVELNGSWKPGAADWKRAGRVNWEGGSFDCDWVSGPGFVHALCREIGAPPPDCLMCERVEALAAKGAHPDAPSRAVRRLALRVLARRMEVDEDALEIRKRGRIPFLYQDNQRLAADLSLSHHGQQVAFACRLEGTVGHPLSTRPPAPSALVGGLRP